MYLIVCWRVATSRSKKHERAMPDNMEEVLGEILAGCSNIDLMGSNKKTEDLSKLFNAFYSYL